MTLSHTPQASNEYTVRSTAPGERGGLATVDTCCDGKTVAPALVADRDCNERPLGKEGIDRGASTSTYEATASDSFITDEPTRNVKRRPCS